MSERPTRALVPLLNEAAVYTTLNIVNAALPFLLVPILTRWLSPSEYGVAAMFAVAVNAFGALAGLNANSAVTVRYFQLSADRIREYIGACLAILVVSTAIVLIVLAPVSSALARVTQVPPGWLALALVVAAGQFVVSIRLILWQVAHKPWRYGAFVLAQSGVHFAMAVLLVVGLTRGWRGAAGANVIATSLGAIAALALLARNDLSTRVSRADVADALRYGAPLIPHILGGLLIASVDRLMIVNLLGVAEAGVYMVGLQIGMALGLLTASFNKAYLPWLFRHLAADDRSGDLRVVRGTYVYFVTVLVLAAALAAAAPMIVDLVAGPSYRESVGAITYVAFAYAFGGMYYMVTNYIFFAGKTSYLAWITLGAGLVGAASSYVLIGQNGIVGAGQAFLLSNVTLFLGTWVLANRVRPMPWLMALHPRRSVAA
jgi:O-antigen/teichoic acid export membrane protein